MKASWHHFGGFPAQPLQSSVAYGGAMPVAPVPSKVGYVFNGWIGYDATATVTQNVNIYSRSCSRRTGSGCIAEHGLYHGLYRCDTVSFGSPYRSASQDGHNPCGYGTERQVFHQRHKGYVALIPQYGHPCAFSASPSLKFIRSNSIPCKAGDQKQGKGEFL